MSGGMIWGWLFLVLLLAGVVLLVVLVVRLLGGGPRNGAGSQGPGPYRQDGGDVGNARARQILAERYARGEIDAAEYDERLKRLRD